MFGGVMSMLIPYTVVVPMFPARSIAVAPTDWLAPSEERVTGGGQHQIPDTASVQVKATVTGPEYQPSALGLVVGDPVIVGGVMSMLIPETVEAAPFPATSYPVAVTDWLTPSLSKVVSGGQKATPESAS